MIGVDYYNVQYEYLVKEWGALGIKYDTLEYVTKKAIMFGPRNGRSLSFDMLRLEQEVVVEDASVSLLVCFGVIAAGSRKTMETQERFESITFQFLRGARRVLKQGGRLILHIEEKPHRKSFALNAAHFLGTELELVGVNGNLFIIQKA